MLIAVFTALGRAALRLQFQRLSIQHFRLDRVHLTDETVRLLGFWNQLDSTERRELLYYLEWRSLKASEKSEKDS